METSVEFSKQLPIQILQNFKLLTHLFRKGYFREDTCGDKSSILIIDKIKNMYTKL